MQQTINKVMKHFIYKTTHKNGKYYIGRHSTANVDDGYIGSGKWPRSIKDKSSLSREILEYAHNELDLIELERKYLAEHFGKQNCMNRTCDPIGWNSETNPMKNPEVVQKFSGDNHWLRKNPERVNDIRKSQLQKVADGTHIFLGDKNPNKDGRNGKLATSRGNNTWQTNNPSKKRSEQGIHHWQNGGSPNYDGKLNKKLVEEGKHNWQGPAQNQKRIDAGTHNFLGSSSNQKMLQEGTHPSQKKKTCDHCNATISVGMHKRWHGDKCKQK